MKISNENNGRILEIESFKDDEGDYVAVTMFYKNKAQPMTLIGAVEINDAQECDWVINNLMAAKSELGWK